MYPLPNNMPVATLLAKFHVLRTGRSRYVRLPDMGSQPDHQPETKAESDSKTRANGSSLALGHATGTWFPAVAKVAKPVEVVDPVEVKKPIAIEKPVEGEKAAAPNMVLIYAILSRIKLAQAGYAVDIIPFVDFRHIDYGKLLTLISEDESVWTFFIEKLR